LIQRDYKTISLYEYHYERKVPEHPTEIKLTDSGRRITGGGGITPDIIVAAPKYTRFEQELFRADVLSGGSGCRRLYARLSWRQAYHHAQFTADDEVMHLFRNYLTKHNVRFSETEIAENQDWIKRKIKQEVFMSTFGMQEGFKVLLEADPQLQKGVEAMTQARALYQNARKIVAQRTGGTIDQP
jgi:carboxyl-terminal processing protease